MPASIPLGSEAQGMGWGAKKTEQLGYRTGGRHAVSDSDNRYSDSSYSGISYCELATNSVMDKLKVRRSDRIRTGNKLHLWLWRT